jgi:hypothetical protein
MGVYLFFFDAGAGLLFIDKNFVPAADALGGRRERVISPE